jgi:polysaccharide export outer membrane protein
MPVLPAVSAAAAAARTWRAAAIIATCAVSLTGCSHDKMYKAASLPPQFEAPVVHSSQQLDFARLAKASIRSDLIHPGDILKVSISTGLEEVQPVSWELRVADDGTVTLPLVGPLQVAGMTTALADQAVRDASIQRGIYLHPQVAVHLLQRKTNRVTVMGAVVEPGVHGVPSAGSDVIAALAAAGGLTEEADTVVEVRNPGNQFSPTTRQVSYVDGAPPPQLGIRTATIDLAYAQTRPEMTDLGLEDGSVVVVRKKPTRTVYVMGLVKNGGQHEIPPDRDLRVLDALALAGGRTLEIADKVRIVRNDPRYADPIVIRASVREAKRNKAANVRLAPGDLITVEETPGTFAIETVRSFVRFGFTGGIPGF